MSSGIDQLNNTEIDHIKGILLNLVRSLEKKKAVGSHQGLITDETIVLTALRHPERGDVEISLFTDKEGLHVFVSNRRELDSPFAVMNLQQSHRHPERRPLDSGNVLKENEYGLFLTSFQDRETLKTRSAAGQLVRVFSTHFGIADPVEKQSNPMEALKGKALAECSLSDKLRIFIDNAPGDPRLDAIKNELFGFKIVAQKYKQKAVEETFFLLPQNFQNTIGQMIRDAYPYGVRKSLRTSFPKDHKQEQDKVHKQLSSLLTDVEIKTHL
ncbi:MAG: hypothetical protein KDK39_10955, partial [Leptospiraceae bacterium]|nr:hypothetical protein [Leptospiraceae bacterium]